MEILSQKEKKILVLGISDYLLRSMEEDRYYEKINVTLNICWEWMETGIPTGDEIYKLLDDGTEFGGLFIYMQMDEEYGNELKWDCIIDAVSYIYQQAYLLNNEMHLPAPIENVSEEIIEHCLQTFEKINSQNEVFIKKVTEYLNSLDEIEKEDIGVIRSVLRGLM